MNLHWGWAVLGALVLGAGLAWWTTRQEGGDWRLFGPGRPATQVHAGARGDDTTVFYRWVDAGGTINVSSTKPPAGIRYTLVRIHPNQNIVPMNTGPERSPAR